MEQPLLQPSIEAIYKVKKVKHYSCIIIASSIVEAKLNKNPKPYMKTLESYSLLKFCRKSRVIYSTSVIT